MNYRHAFHAGNFADVFKHAVLARILVHLSAKDTAWRMLDTHAGTGRYDLGADPATRTGEWRQGIGRIAGAALEPNLASLLAPYLDAVAAANGVARSELAGGLSAYPGSPLVARHLMRRIDRLTATELHPDDHAALAALFAGDIQVRVVALDGWLALKSFVPFKERRGVVLVDPPFEAPGEFDRLVEGLLDAHRRFATGVFALWYPIKDERAVRGFRAALAETGLRKMLASELRVGPIAPDRPLAGCGLVVVNPPWRLADELAVIGPGLARLLAIGTGAGARTEWLAGE